MVGSRSALIQHFWRIQYANRPDGQLDLTTTEASYVSSWEPVVRGVHQEVAWRDRRWLEGAIDAAPVRYVLHSTSPYPILPLQVQDRTAMMWIPLTWSI